MARFLKCGVGVSELRGGWRYGYLETVNEILNLCVLNMA
jgi:hypothetical protein